MRAIAQKMCRLPSASPVMADPPAPLPAAPAHPLEAERDGRRTADGLGLAPVIPCAGGTCGHGRLAPGARHGGGGVSPDFQIETPLPGVLLGSTPRSGADKNFSQISQTPGFCPLCGAAVTQDGVQPGGSPRKYCSRDHKRRAQQLRYAARVNKTGRHNKRPEVPGVCDKCGRAFVGARETQRFCSVKCRTAAHLASPFTRAAQNANKRRAAAKTQAYITSFKVARGCEVCGYKKCPKALHFHHLDGGDKEKEISKCISVASFEREAPKCIVLCANCHAELHEREAQKNLA